MREIPGKKIQLRDWSLGDLAAFEHWQKPGHKWQALDGPYYQSTVDRSQFIAAELKARIEENNFPEPRMKLVVADLKTDQLLGTVSSYWESKETNWLCIGIAIFDPASWGRGIGFEALGHWLNYLFSSRPELVRLDMRTWSGNPGLIALAKKHGFQQEACFRMARIVGGEYFDGLGFGILRSEWEKLHPDGFYCP